MPETALPGRRGQAARNDVVILDAARQVFLVDPKAPISHVAERAGVGISALYRRYPSKEFLLCRLCHDGLRTLHRRSRNRRRGAGRLDGAAPGSSAGSSTPTCTR